MVLDDLAMEFSQTVMDTTDFFMVLVGSGSASTVLDLVKKYLPVEGLAAVGDDILATIVGYIIWKYGDRIHPMLKPFGLGVFIAGAGSVVGGFVEQAVAGLTG